MSQRYGNTDKLEVYALPGLIINLEDIFEEDAPSFSEGVANIGF